MKIGRSRVQTLVATVVTPPVLLLVVLACTPIIDVCWGFDADGRHYGLAAYGFQTGQPVPHEAPWCWRPLTPWLASLLPFSLLTNFRVLAFLSDWLSLALLYGILRKFALPYGLSLVGMVMYVGVFWTVKFSFYSPAYIDFMTLTFILAVLYCTTTQRYWMTLILLPIGVLQKEALLFLGPVVWIHYASSAGWLTAKSIAFLATLIAVPGLFIAIVRTSIVPVNQFTSFRLILVNIHFLSVNVSWWPRVVLAVFSGLGMLTVLLVFRARVAVRFLRKHPHLSVYLAASSVLLLGGTDKARLFLYLVPLAVVMAVHILHHMFDHARSVRRVWIWLVTTMILHLYLGHHLTPMTTQEDYLNTLVPVHAAPGVEIGGFTRVGSVLLLWLAVTACTVGFRSRSERKPESG